MTDLLTPKEVREMLVLVEQGRWSEWPYEKTPDLCRDYLTLWEKVVVLEGTVDLLRETCGFDKLHTESPTHD